MTSPRSNLAHARNDRGAVMVFATLIIVVLLLAAGLVIDLGQQRAAARDVQADADVIALDMARLSDGNTTISVLAGSNHSVVLGELNASAGRNQVEGIASKDDGTPEDNAGRILLLEGDDLRLEVQWGWLSEDPDPSQCGQQTQIRDEADSPWFAECTLGSQTPNAARVTGYDSVGFRLLPVGNGPSRGGVVRTAYARHGAEDLAGFQLGAYGATLLEDGILNNMLEPLLGPDPVNSGVLTPDGLALADANLFEVAAELGLLTPEEALNTELPISQFMAAAATVFARNGDAATAAALNEAVSLVQDDVSISLGDVVDVSNGAASSGADIALNALDLLRTGASIASCTPPSDLDDYQVEDCAGVIVPSLETDLGLATSTGSLKIIESRRRKYGYIGDGIRNSQLQLTQHIELSTQQTICTLPPVLGISLCTVLGLGGAVNLSVSVDLTVRLADGYTSIHDIVCPDPRRLDLRSSTGLYSIEAGIHVNLPLSLGSVNSVGSLNAPPDQADIVRFDVPPDVLGETEKRSGAGTIGLGNVSMSTTANLLGIQLNVVNNILGNVTNLIVNPLIDAIDTTVLAPLTNVLGIDAVGSELVALDIDCGAGGVQLVG